MANAFFLLYQEERENIPSGRRGVERSSIAHLLFLLRRLNEEHSSLLFPFGRRGTEKKLLEDDALFFSSLPWRKNSSPPVMIRREGIYPALSLSPLFPLSVGREERRYSFFLENWGDERNVFQLPVFPLEEAGDVPFFLPARDDSSMFDPFPSLR